MLVGFQLRQAYDVDTHVIPDLDNAFRVTLVEPDARYRRQQLYPDRGHADYIGARQGYDYSHHGQAGNPSTDFVPDDIVDRFCVLGAVEDHIVKLNELRDLGADQFNIYLMHDAMEETLEAYGEEIIPELDLQSVR